MVSTVGKMERNLKKQGRYLKQLEDIKVQEEIRKEDNLFYSKQESEVTNLRKKLSMRMTVRYGASKKESSQLLKEMKRHNHKLKRSLKHWSDDYWRELDYKQQKFD